jgi:hypothetical protein
LTKGEPSAVFLTPDGKMIYRQGTWLLSFRVFVVLEPPEFPGKLYTIGKTQYLVDERQARGTMFKVQQAHTTC